MSALNCNYKFGMNGKLFGLSAVQNKLESKVEVNKRNDGHPEGLAEVE